MDDIQVNASHKIKSGKTEDLKKLAHSSVNEVKQKDKGTIQYDWFFNDLKPNVWLESDIYI